MGGNNSYAFGLLSVSNAVLCAKASMLLQNVPPAVLPRYLREHRSEWADSGVDAYYSAADVKAGPCGLPGSRCGSFGGQVILPLAHTIEDEELCSGVGEKAIGTCAELIFAPIDGLFSDDAPLLPSGFCIIPHDSKTDASSPNCTLDLVPALEVGPAGNKGPRDYSGHGGIGKSVMTIAFQFVFEIHLQKNIAAMARQYLCSIIASVQRVALHSLLPVLALMVV